MEQVYTWYRLVSREAGNDMLGPASCHPALQLLLHTAQHGKAFIAAQEKKSKQDNPRLRQAPEF